MAALARVVSLLAPLSIVALLACDNDAAHVLSAPIASASATSNTPPDTSHIPAGCSSITTSDYVAVVCQVAVAFPPTAMVVVSGNGQTGTPGAPLRDSIIVQTQDDYGNAVGGATVTWIAAGDSGTVSASTSVTDANGLARAKWTTGAGSPLQAIRVVVNGVTPLRVTANIVP